MAASTSTKMNFNYGPNGKYGILPQNTSQKDMEVTQEMHIKMSKKIAQLTKVIYALNTKNDEHEAIVAALREQQEDQIQQIIAENSAKVACFKAKLQNSSDHSTQVQTLQEKLSEHDLLRARVLREFQDYKERTEQQEFDLKTQYAQKMTQMAHDALRSKQALDRKLDDIENVRDQFEMEKQKALAAAEERHQTDMERVLQSKDGDEQKLDELKERLSAEHRTEVEKLMDQLENLNSEKGRVVEDYELKLSKAQAFYDKELEVLQNSHNMNHEEQMEVLKEAFQKAKRDAEFNENQSKKRNDDLLNQLSISEEEVEKYKNEVINTKSRLENKDSDVALLNKQLADAKAHGSTALTRLKEVEAELSGSRALGEQQAKDLIKKSTQIGELDATRMQQEMTISDLRGKLAQLSDRLAFLEQTKRTLEDKSSSSANEYTEQIFSLEKALRDMSKEKEDLRESLEKELQSVRLTTSETEKRLLEEHNWQMESQNQKYNDDREQQRRESEILQDSIKQDLETLRLAEVKALNDEKEAMKQEFEALQSALEQKLSKTESEIRQLEDQLKDGITDQSAIQKDLQQMREASRLLENELSQVKNQHGAATAKAHSLQSEYEKLQKQHEKSLKDAESELKTKLDQLSKDLDNKWRETLRLECDKLRRELIAQKEEDKRAAMEQLSRLKDEEASAVQKGWENKVQVLMIEISELKQSLESRAEISSTELENIRRKAEADNVSLQKELLRSAEEFGVRIDEIERQHREFIADIEMKHEAKLRSQESEFKMKHLSEIQASTMAHKALVEAKEQDAEKRRLQEMESQKNALKGEMDDLRAEMEQKMMSEMDEVNRGHQQQMMAARMELERAMEITRQKEGEYAMNSSELEENIRHREQTIHHLESELRNLQKGINEMSKELDSKGKEVLRIRSEANSSARAHKEQLLAAHKVELTHLLEQHQSDAQEMLAEFTEAQEILKDKISELHILLEEAEDRYMKRESRPEDREMIQNLQMAIQDAQRQIQQLMEDKKRYQMELVNRETNFNKMFNGDPKVGVLNPLSFPTHKKSKGDRNGARGSGSVHNRLDPLPGSPHHDGHFNSARPLPPPTKKFIK